MRFKPLSKDQRERFKELYLAGYSFSLIFEKLGCYDADDRGSGKYEVLGRAYRKRLGLQPRGNVKPKFYRGQVTAELIVNRRIGKLKKMIPEQEKRLTDWKAELVSLLKKQSGSL
jgi:hypothetical protein